MSGAGHREKERGQSRAKTMPAPARAFELTFGPLRLDRGLLGKPAVPGNGHAAVRVGLSIGVRGRQGHGLHELNRDPSYGGP